MSVAISIENVIKRFGKDTIINGLSLDVRPVSYTHLGPGWLHMRGWPHRYLYREQILKSDFQA